MPRQQRTDRGTRAVAVRERNDAAPAQWNEQDEIIIQDMLSKDITQAEFRLYLRTAAYMGLNPLKREIYAVKYGGRLVLQVGIDGHLKHAQESGKFAGFSEPSLTVKSKDDPTPREIPHRLYDPDTHTIISATIGVKHTDDDGPMYVTCTWKGYAQYFKGKLSDRWEDGGDRQLIKCAQALAIRTRFAGMAGVVSPAEMGAVERGGTIDAEFNTVEEPPSTADKEAEPKERPKQEDPKTKAKSEEPPPVSSEEDQQRAIKEFVAKKVRPFLESTYPATISDQGEISRVVWTVVLKHFEIDGLSELPIDKIPQILTYMGSDEFHEEMMQENFVSTPRND